MDMISDRINMVINIKGIKKTEFARRLKISDSSVSTMCSGKSKPSSQTIAMICYEFGVNEEWLRTGNGEMFVSKTVDTLDELVQRLGLSDGDRLLIEKFLALKPSERQAVLRYVLSVAADYPGPTSPAFAPVHIPTIEEEAHAEAEEYYRRILAEKELAAKSQVLPNDTNNGTPKMA